MIGPRYMLDTNTASYVIKSVPTVRRHLLAVPGYEMCISVITQAELLFGIVRKPQEQDFKNLVREFLLSTNILAWDEGAAHQYAHLRAELERKGKSMSNMDMLIAAHALAAGVTLVTNDQSFRHIDQLPLTNWVE